MPNYEPGNYINFEIKTEQTGESEWMWLIVDRVDDSKQVVFGRLESQTDVFAKELSLGQELAESLEDVREHKRSDAF